MQRAGAINPTPAQGRRRGAGNPALRVSQRQTQRNAGDVALWYLSGCAKRCFSHLPGGGGLLEEEEGLRAR
jgi:hypothetical protein